MYTKTEMTIELAMKAHQATACAKAERKTDFVEETDQTTTYTETGANTKLGTRAIQITTYAADEASRRIMPMPAMIEHLRQV